jgi:hypothetical protein
VKTTLQLIGILILSLSAGAQEWASSAKTDQLSGKPYTEYTLTGKFLTPPTPPFQANFQPAILLRCDPARHGRISGKLVEGFIVVGTVVDLPMQFRLDEGKVQTIYDGGGVGYSSNYQGVSLSDVMVNNLLWGHMIPHKPGKGDQVRKVVISVQQHLAGQVVMQFDMPEAETVGAACGTEYVK